MRYCVVLCILVMAGCGGKTKPPVVVQKPQHDYQGWKDYASPEATFTVRFPAAPVIKPASPATGNMHVVGVPPQANDDLEYLCQWTLKAQPFGSKEAEEEYLKGQQLGAVNSCNGKLLEEKAISADGFPGRQFIIESANRDVLHCQSFLAGKRVITLQVWGKAVGSVKSPKATKYFDSLTISP